MLDGLILVVFGSFDLVCLFVLVFVVCLVCLVAWFLLCFVCLIVWLIVIVGCAFVVYGLGGAIVFLVWGLVVPGYSVVVCWLWFSCGFGFIVVVVLGCCRFL